MKRDSKSDAVKSRDPKVARLRGLAKQAERVADAATTKAREAKAKVKQARREAKDLRRVAREAKKAMKKAVHAVEKAVSKASTAARPTRGANKKRKVSRASSRKRRLPVKRATPSAPSGDPGSSALT
ncbi:MAG: hypothetical protein AB7O66_22110 [Limisphaerales bacterium]